MALMFKNKIIAFTLAEILIVLGIIGIIAAITIPSIIQKYTEKQTVIKLKKAYSVLCNAYKLAQNEYGDNFARDIYLANLTNTKERSFEFLEKIKPFFTDPIDCQKEGRKCYSRIKGRNYYYNFLEAKGNDFWPSGYPSILLKDGTLIIVHTDYYRLYSFVIDVNGPKGPNHYGHDTFFFDLNWVENYNKISPRKASKNSKTCHLNSSVQARGCAWWVFTNENLDYLHCDLDWNTQTKCQ